MSRPHESTDAIVLRAVPYRDADQILTFMTRDLGRISALARGARSSRKRFGGALGSFTVSRIEITRRPGSELYTLKGATSIRAFMELAADMVALSHASYATELVRELSSPEQVEPGMFSLLVELLETVAELGPSVSMLRAFELSLLSELGLAPVLDACAGCGLASDDDLEEGAVLDAPLGGVACASCAARTRSLGVRVLSGPARRILLEAQRAERLADAHDRGAEPPPASVEARDALMSAVLAQVGKPLRSLEFAAKLSGSR